MSKVNSLLTQRLKQASQKFSKMTELAEMASDGNLSSFSGVFRINPLTSSEKDKIESILQSYKNQTQDIDEDLKNLYSITSEVKAINNQAAILHGERIKRAQDILKKYQDGAFTQWLISTYGNRQTPYNFLQYYEMHRQLPQALHKKLDEMPRQAVYTLASRSAPLEQKEELIKSYDGQSKNELLAFIRKLFPLNEKDKRREDLSVQAITALRRISTLFADSRFQPTKGQKKQIKSMLQELCEISDKA